MDKEQGVRWKDFRIGDLFEKIETKKIHGKANDFPEQPQGKFTIPLLTAGIQNQGLSRYAMREQCPTILKNVLSVSANGVNSGIVFYQPDEFAVLQDAYAVQLIGRAINGEKEGLFLATLLNKAIFENHDWNNKAGWNNIKDDKFSLPVTDGGTPDWDYMAKRIKELETERIKELEAYLLASGLDDYELTEADKQVLAEEVQWKEFRIGDLFEIHSPVKKFNANKVSFNGKYPYVARGTSNNGIRGYITEDVAYLNPAHTLSFGQDTATVYYQNEPYFTGDKIKIMELKNVELTESIAAFLVPVVRRAFSGFAWGQNSFNEKVLNNIEVVLPVGNDNQPDWDYMERYIRVIEKSVITDVVKWKDQQITVTKQVVDKSIA